MTGSLTATSQYKQHDFIKMHTSRDTGLCALNGPLKKKKKKKRNNAHLLRRVPEVKVGAHSEFDTRAGFAALLDVYRKHL